MSEQPPPSYADATAAPADPNSYNYAYNPAAVQPHTQVIIVPSDGPTAATTVSEGGSTDWTCPQCTLQNDFNAPNCTACNYANPNRPAAAAYAAPVQMGGNRNLPVNEAWKQLLQSQQTWCCSYWVYLHIFLIALLVICVINAYQYYSLLYLGTFPLLAMLVACFGVLVSAYGLYGLYNCIPASYLLICVFIICDCIVDILFMITYGLTSFWSLFWLVIWFICAWQFFRLYQFCKTFKSARMWLVFSFSSFV